MLISHMALSLPATGLHGKSLYYLFDGLQEDSLMPFTTMQWPIGEHAVIQPSSPPQGQQQLAIWRPG